MAQEWYSHPIPHQGPNGTILIMYEYKPYPCPEATKWKVLNQAMAASTAYLANTVMKDPESSTDLKAQSLKIYHDTIRQKLDHFHNSPKTKCHFLDDSAKTKLDLKIFLDENLPKMAEQVEEIKKNPDLAKDQVGINFMEMYQNLVDTSESLESEIFEF